MTENVVTLFPAKLQGEVSIPSSKSLAHRAIICASLANGRSKISNISYSEDIDATIFAMEQIGAKIERYDNYLIIKGIKFLKAPTKPIDCNESGSTIRFLIPIMSLTNKKVILTGKPSLLTRPQTVYEELFKNSKSHFSHTATKIVVKGSIKANEYHIDGTISSQFFTGLMFALPLLKEDSYIYVDGHLESKGYIDLTIDILEHFGIEIVEIDNGYYIKGNQSYIPHDYKIEGDYSQAAFFLVGGLLNGNVLIHDLPHESKQGDRAIIEIIKRMKGRVIYTGNGYITEKSNTYSTEIDIANCPDLGPIISLLAAVSNGTTTIINAARLRLKESDRIESTVNTLKALGADIKSVDDNIIIHGKSTLKGGTVMSYNDHRIVMMAAIASTICENKVIINGANAINKSYPHFFQDFKNLQNSPEKE